jgi:PilZ domain
VGQEAERRQHLRRAVALDVIAWSLVQPTRLLTGRTIDLGAGGALLALAGLDEAAVRLDLRIALPSGTLRVSANVLEQRRPDVVAVAFHPLDSADEARVNEFLETIA